MTEPHRTETDVAIVGAGIWGLATAEFLTRLAPAAQVTLFEAAARYGGAVETVRRGDYLFEPGPNSLLDNSEDLRLLLRQTGLEEQVLEADPDAARNRYIVRGGRLRRLPMGPPAFLRTDLFTLGAKMRLLREPFIRPAPADAKETLADFVVRRLGSEFLDYAIDPFVSGTFAGVPEELSVRAAFRRLWSLEQTHGSLIKGAVRLARQRRRAAAAVGREAGEAGRIQAGPSGRMLSFRDGLQTLVETLAAPRRDEVHTGRALRALRREEGGFHLTFDGTAGLRQTTARAVLLTIPAHAWAAVDFGFEVPAEGLAGIPYPPVTTVFFGYDRDPQEAAAGDPLRGFGFLVPRVEQRHILGTLWSASAYPGRAPTGGAAFTTFVGGRRQPEVARWEDDRLVAVVRQELLELMGVDAAPDVVEVRRWERAIPQYLGGHLELMGRLDALEAREPGLVVGGNFRGGISIGDCVTAAHQAARKLVALLQD